MPALQWKRQQEWHPLTSLLLLDKQSNLLYPSRRLTGRFVNEQNRLMSADKEDAARRKQQIIEAATTVFARKGFHGATMDDIVAESGLSKGGLYWYFEGKDDIIAAILRQFFDQEMVGLEAVVAAGGPATAQLLQLARRLAAEMEEAARMLPISLEFYAVAARQEAVRQWIKGYLIGRAHV